MKEKKLPLSQELDDCQPNFVDDVSTGYIFVVAPHH